MRQGVEVDLCMDKVYNMDSRLREGKETRALHCIGRALLDTTHMVLTCTSWRGLTSLGVL